MGRKTIFIYSVIIALSLICGPLVLAKAYKITAYVFTWEARATTAVTMNIQKDPSGVWVVLKSPGGSAATVAIAPSQAKALSAVLAKAPQYHKAYSDSVNDKAETVPAGDVFVTFSSGRKGSNFKVRVHNKRIITAAALMDKEDAVRLSEHLLEAEAMAAHVDKLIRP